MVYLRGRCVGQPGWPDWRQRDRHAIYAHPAGAGRRALAAASSRVGLCTW